MCQIITACAKCNQNAKIEGSATYVFSSRFDEIFTFFKTIQLFYWMIFPVKLFTLIIFNPLIPGFKRSHFRYSFGIHLRHWQRKQTLHQLAQGCWFEIISCWRAWQASSKTIDSWLSPSICSCNKKAGTIKIYKCLIKKLSYKVVFALPYMKN